MSDFHNRDYSKIFTIELEWHEWNRLHNMYVRAMDNKDYDSWGDDEQLQDRELREKLTLKIGENSPGNGMNDWPDSMKEAYSETVMEMIDDLE